MEALDLRIWHLAHTLPDGAQRSYLKSLSRDALNGILGNTPNRLPVALHSIPACRIASSLQSDDIRFRHSAALVVAILTPEELSQAMTLELLDSHGNVDHVYNANLRETYFMAIAASQDVQEVADIPLTYAEMEQLADRLAVERQATRAMSY
jgi:hypothetical protein